MTTSTPTPGFLDAGAPPVLIFGGKGGVGKTTSACATAIATARRHPDESVILVSTDPAHSVRDALADTELPANLTVEELDAATEHTDFMDRHTETLRTIASRGTFLDDADIARFLDLSIPGVDELMSFLRLSNWFQEERADRFIVDTAPTGHALRLLSMPAVTGGWMEAIEALLGKHRFMASVFGSGADDPVEDFVDELQEAFDNIAGVWSDASLTQFIPVFNAEPLSIAETARLLESLDELHIAAPELVLNRVVPGAAQGSLAQLASAQRQALSRVPAPLADRSIIAVPLDPEEPRGRALDAFFDNASAWVPDTGNPIKADDAPPRVGGTVRLAKRLTLVAGKGGVGKTTVSSALASASASAGQRTLLVSTDPAGSLGDAFETDIGAEPTPIAEGLSAIQLDADAELEQLKQMYADETEAFFDSLSMDLSFDREALENLLELAPTGIDEVMALVRMTEILDTARDADTAVTADATPYDTVLIDTAPTGHTLRLLELPGVVQAWLEQIFAVLLKYEDLIRLPRLNERLIRLSRGVKKLRALLADADATGVLCVTIPTTLAAAETERLIKGCEKLGVPVTGVVINQLTTPGNDLLSAAVADREATQAQALRDIARGRDVATITRGSAIQGHAQLLALGTDLTRNTQDLRAAA